MGSRSRGADIFNPLNSAFKTLIMDPQFAPLGLVLLGLLARVANITGMTEHYKSLAMEVEDEEERRWKERVVEGLERFAAEGILKDPAVGERLGAEDEEGGGPEQEDIGEVVERAAVEGLSTRRKDDEPPKRKRR